MFFHCCRFFAAAYLCVCCTNVVLGKEPPKKPTTAEFERPIDALASTNVEPGVEGRPGSIEIPKGYDHGKQLKIYQTWDRLLEIGPPAIPSLLKHRDDAQYSVTVASTISEVWKNRSVGFVCTEIVLNTLEPYGHFTRGPCDRRNAALRPCYTCHFLLDASRRNKWLESHAELSRHDLQLEAAEWILSQEEGSGKYNREEIEYMKENVRKLRAAKEPLAPLRVSYSWIKRLTVDD